MLRLLAAIFYRVLYLLHHKLCLRPGSPPRYSKLAVVGAYRTGGAGKTPFCIWLAENLAAQRKRVAILCHEYALDEAKMLREHFASTPGVEIFTTRNRYRLVHELDRSRRFDILLCDDGFEDSRLAGATTFVLLWEKLPTRIRELWPLGNARSLAKDHHGRTVKIRCNATPDIRFVLDKVSDADGKPFRESNNRKQTIVFCGLGDPNRFCGDIEKLGIAVTEKVFLKDHDRQFAYRLNRAMQDHPQAAFIISAKDAARLQGKASDTFQWGENLYIAHQKAVVSDNTARIVLRELLNS